MTDNSLKISELPTAANVASTDRILVLRDPAGSPSVRTVSSNALYSSISADIIPSVDDQYSLGNTSNRWQSIHIGPGSLYLYDIATATVAEITIDSGVLKINGTNQLQVGQLKFIDNTIQSETSNVDIQIGTTTDTANLVLNRSVSLASGKTLTINGDTFITGNFIHNGLDVEPVNWITVTTAGTYVASTTVSKNILIYTGGAVNVTWTMPPNPIDGQVCSWTNSSNSTSVFFITAGPTLVPPISGPYSAGTKFNYVWRASSSKWYDLP